MILHTPRLVLKPHVPANAELLNAWQNDPELIYYDDDVPEDREPRPIARTHEFIERNASPKLDDEIIHWAIHIAESDQFIGYCMAAYIDTFNQKCRFGMTMGAKEEWGKGYGREALEAVVRFIFGELKLNRIQCEIYDFNERSIRLFESVGFVREGVCREAVWKRGRFANEYVYGLLRSDFEGRQKSTLF